ncbi:uncharacterized protein N7473_008251 [Penicillium subrubescens]|uniref:uncharacterized protein n=1 Tax=Penicillium subrubescens TaxID=1316194 RepID=UPI0025456BC4|nr:uncharacterized protein N7473_008251 [Penicillium subrubescens]KAJ5892023.1 hypothetical protein N7473_008251 [Penicillium subrubescens]
MAPLEWAIKPIQVDPEYTDSKSGDTTKCDLSTESQSRGSHAKVNLQFDTILTSSSILEMIKRDKLTI